MFFAHNLTTYSPKNKKNAELVEFVKSKENVFIPSELDKDAFVMEISTKIDELNVKYPKVKEIKLVADNYGVRASIYSNGVPDEVFILRITKVRSVFRFSEKSAQSRNLNLLEGGTR